MDSSISQIRKRDGRIVAFEPDKIVAAIHKAIVSTETEDGKAAEELGREVVRILEQRFVDKIPGVEDVQDIVEEVLIQKGFAKVAKAYIIYRQKRSDVREAKKIFGVTDELKLSLNAISVLERRYLLKDEKGAVVETPTQMFQRVARAVAQADLLYDEKADVQRTEAEFYQIMRNLEFIPNSPTLMNAGTAMGQLAACFVIPVDDSIESIFDAVKNMAVIHKSGGGTGFSFSRLRPKGDVVKTTKGVASGPVSFMRIFDTATDVIKQGGRRRGANMGILRVDHPDIIEFVTSKSKEGFLSNFNISVAVTDAFMEAVEKDQNYDLVNPRTKEPVRTLRARDIFSLIVTQAWRTGDPGLIFIDEINRHNPTPKLGAIESTNPCGEQPLLAYESCNLGSINLAKMVREGQIDYEKLARIVRISVHFLDNVIDVNRFPLPEIEAMTKANRKIGLGVMGFADALVQMNIRYDSEEALSVGEKIMNFIAEEAKKASVELAEKRGSFPNFSGSIYDRPGAPKLRNATLLTIAPTGTISIIAGCASGIEPLFAISYIRNVMEGTRLLEVNPYFEKVAKERGFYSTDLMVEISKRGSIREIKEIPEDVRNLFVTAMDISPEWHVRMQAAFQRHVDNAVSKTVNLPQDATIGDIERIYLLAHKLGCKGITVYRYGSKTEQVLYIGSVAPRVQGESAGFISASAEYAGGCMTPLCQS
jgi:ribonucleoside-diphosphate reductase alpha chain